MVYKETFVAPPPIGKNIGEEYPEVIKVITPPEGFGTEEEDVKGNPPIEICAVLAVVGKVTLKNKVTMFPIFVYAPFVLEKVKPAHDWSVGVQLPVS